MKRRPFFLCLFLFETWCKVKSRRSFGSKCLILPGKQVAVNFHQLYPLKTSIQLPKKGYESLSSPVFFSARMCWGDVLEVLRFTRVRSPNCFFFELHMLFHPQQKGMSQVNSTLKTCSRGDSIRELFIPARWRSPTTFETVTLSRELTIPKRVQRNCQGTFNISQPFFCCHVVWP